MREKQRFDRLVRANRRLKFMCAGLALAMLLGVGLAMQPGRHDGGAGTVVDSLAVDASTGFAVFARIDGNLVIVKQDGTVITTTSQPLSVDF